MKRFLLVGLIAVFPVTAQNTPDVTVSLQRALAGIDRANAELAYAGFVNGGVVKNAPYSAEATTTTTQTLSDGNRIEQSTTQKLYRDSQGRERREESPMAIGALAQPDAQLTIRISDPMERVSYTLDPQRRTAQKTPGFRLSKGANQTFYFNFSTTVPAAADTTRKKEDLGSQTIEGVMAQGTRTTETIPAGQIGNLLPINIVDEVWYSPDLKMNVLTRHSDPRSGESLYKLTNINRGEQPRSLFEPPADYTLAGPGRSGGGGGRGVAPEHPIPAIQK